MELSVFGVHDIAGSEFLILISDMRIFGAVQLEKLAKKGEEGVTTGATASYLFIIPYKETLYFLGTSNFIYGV